MAVEVHCPTCGKDASGLVAKLEAAEKMAEAIQALRDGEQVSRDNWLGQQVQAVIDSLAAWESAGVDK